MYLILRIGPRSASQNPDSDKSKWLTGVELAEVYHGYFKKYDICTIEDPFDQDDWEAWSAFNQDIKIQNVGDDLLVTNPMRIKTAIEKKACNALLLKVGRETPKTFVDLANRSTKSAPSPNPSKRASRVRMRINAHPLQSSAFTV